MIKTCQSPKCGCQFETKYETKLYCSYKCMNRERKLRYKQRDPDRFRRLVQGKARRKYAASRWHQIDRRLRVALNLFYKHGHLGKAEFIGKVIGLSHSEFIKVLHRPEGMTFDHKIPVSAFDITKPEHILRLNHYTNLQVLSHEDNIKKGASCPPNLDIMSLPCVDTPEALNAARLFITKPKDRIAGVDWSKSVDEIVAQTGMKRSTIECYKYGSGRKKLKAFKETQ